MTHLKQSQEFEDNHDNDNHSNDVKDVSVHAGYSYQSECAVASIPDRAAPRICGSPVIRVYDEAGNVIETHEHKGDFKEW